MREVQQVPRIFLSLRYVVELMLICVLSLCCGGVAADVRYDFALLPLYGVRLVTYIQIPPERSGRVSAGPDKERRSNLSAPFRP